MRGVSVRNRHRLIASDAREHVLAGVHTSVQTYAPWLPSHPCSVFKELVFQSPHWVAWAVTGSSMATLWANVAATPVSGLWCGPWAWRRRGTWGTSPAG